MKIRLIDLESPMKKFLLPALVLSLSAFGTVSADTAPATSEVGQASSQSASNAKSHTWQNIGLAVGAVAVATVALILVSNDGGSSHSNSHADSH